MDWRRQLNNLPGGRTPGPVRASSPLPRGSRVTGFSVRRPDGSRVSAQTRPLVPWPDGSGLPVAVERRLRGE